MNMFMVFCKNSCYICAMTRKILLAAGLISLVAGGLSSCSTDVDIAGNYKETTIVYGLLNQYDTVQYIRIQKAFLVNDNVLDYTKVPDSIYYKPEDLNVRIEKLNPTNNQVIQTIPCFPTTIGKDTGTFAGGNQLMYRTNVALDSSKTYKLRITNLKTGKEISGTTSLVSGLKVKQPGTGTVVWNSPSRKGYDIKWSPASNGYIYQMQIVFHWVNEDILSGATSKDSVIWSFAPIQRSGSAEIVYNIPQNNFYRFVQEQLEPAPGIRRKIGLLDFRFYVGTEALDQYISINKPSTGLIQEKPLYTNMENALGIFSARGRFEKKGVAMSSAAMDTLVLGPFTANLGFKKP